MNQHIKERMKKRYKFSLNHTGVEFSSRWKKTEWKPTETFSEAWICGGVLSYLAVCRTNDSTIKRTVSSTNRELLARKIQTTLTKKDTKYLVQEMRVCNNWFITVQ